MFGPLKKLFEGEEQAEKIIAAPVSGKVVPMSEVSDPTSNQEILGEGVAIISSEGKIMAPADDLVTMVFDTKHALSVQTKSGAEPIIHIGLNTVQLKGQCSGTYVKAGDKVKRKDLLLEFDIDKIKEAGHDVITPIIICNTPEFPKMECLSGMDVEAGGTTVIKL